MSNIPKKILLTAFLLTVAMFHNFAWSQDIIVGAERTSEYLPLLKNKRVGLLVNPTSMVGRQHLVDSLIDSKVDIRLIFAPEHGFRGKHGAGELVLDNRDIKTGLPIISLHGKLKKPTQQHLKQIDIMIFDIQDVGVRYYTYISSMHYLMEACAENNIPLVVFDRPNPNGDYIDGPVLKREFASFIGMHPIPIVHGLTVAELALMINGEGWLANEKQCDLTVIKLLNYDHNRYYSLPIKPSPNLPNDLSIRLYPSLGFFEATPVSIGRGTDWPFQILGYANKAMGDFEFVPEKIRGSWSDLNHAGKHLFGERLIDIPTSGQIDLSYLARWYKKFNAQDIEFINRPVFFDKLVGTDEFRKKLKMGLSMAQLRQSWQVQLRRYQIVRSKYLLYPDSQIILTKYK